MDIEALALEAADIIEHVPHGLTYSHGIEVAAGFFNLHNRETGQSKVVLYHPESDFVFKIVYQDYSDKKASRRTVGRMSINGQRYRIRLPEFYTFSVNDHEWVEAQEYIVGEPCECDMAWCDHANRMRAQTNCPDTHRGNWKIVDNEIVLFDFEGIRL